MVLTTALITIYSVRAQSGYTVTERGPDYKVLQKTVVQNGTNRVSRYVEMATGLNYTNTSGQLVEASEQITILPNGGAAALQGRHKVYFPADIYNGVLEVITPDGRHLRSRPLGVSYDDGSNTVFIATLKDAVGYLTSSNTVTYRDAFQGIKADLVCQYRRGGFSSELVLRQQPPTPGDYGLEESFSTLQMITEFFDTADPQQIPAGSDEWFGLQDTTLKFGSLTMTHGRAFAFKGTNSTAQTPDPRTQTPVYKSWQHIGGRTFLIEQVPVLDLADNLNALPLTASYQKPATGKFKLASSHREFPPGHGILADTNRILLAYSPNATRTMFASDWSREPGVVLDYTTVDSDQTDYTFTSGTTYLINGTLNMGGTATFQGGAVIKFLEDGVSGLSSVDYINPIIQTSSDQPLVFTSANDNTVGETIAGSSGSPASAGNTYLDGFCFYDPTNMASYLYFRYAGVGLQLSWEPNYIHNCRFENCDGGIWTSGGEIDLFNVLFFQCPGTVLVLKENFDFIFFNAEQVTAVISPPATVDDDVYFLGGDPRDVAYLHNCLFAGYNQDYMNDLFAASTVQACVASNGTSWFASGGNAHFYLAGASLYRNVGTTNFYLGDTFHLSQELKTETTYAPQDGGFPDTNTPDLGYHYPTNEDSDFDGIPDGWIWHWFGSYAYSGTNVDFQGSTFQTDYNNGADPNVIQFTVAVANNYVNYTNPALKMNLAAGIPYYYTVQLDNTNYLAATNWTAYTSADTTASLGTNEGWHGLWVGLKGFPTNATITWQHKRLKLDRTPPQLTITNPTGSTISVPLIQLQGFSPEALSSISYNITNALGLVTNQQALILDQVYSTNTWEFTTNTFQAFDVPLTNGLNTITLHATDLAGNVAMTNFNVTVDYSTATNPVVQLTWPQNGMQVCQSNFTLRGWVNDPTASVSASITDTNGDTNVITGVVERTGVFWEETLPLNSGTNWLILSVTNAAGLPSKTNITLVKSDMTLTLNPLSDNSQLWQPTLALTGNVSDATATIFVNGVQGTNNGDGTWNASGVPASAGGVGSFDLKAIPAGGGVKDANINVDKPARLYMESYSDTETKTINQSYSYAPSYYGITWSDYIPTYTLTVNWRENIGGSSSYHSSLSRSDDIDGPWTGGYQSQDFGFYPTLWPAIESYYIYSSWSGLYNYTISEEHCEIGTPVVDGSGFYQGPGYSGSYSENESDTGERHAEAHMKFVTGGKAGSKWRNLFCLTCPATQYLVSQKWPPPASVGEVFLGTATVLPTSIALGGLGTLNADGNLWAAPPDGGTPIDVPPLAKGVDYFTFTEGQQKHDLLSLSEVSGATEIDATNWAAVKTPTNDWVYLQAQLSTADTNAAPFIQWSGGEPVPGQPFQRRVTKTASAKTTVTATLGPTNLSLNVWIIWATLNIQTSGNNPSTLSFPTNWSCAAGNQLGIQYGSNSNSAAGKVCVIGTATPSGVHAVMPNGWGIVQKYLDHRFKDGATNEYFGITLQDDMQEGSVGGETGLPYEANTLDNADKFYSIDGPFIDITHNPAIDSWEIYDNYYDWATCGSLGGQVCSDTNDWHVQIIWKSDQTPQIISAAVGIGSISLPPNPSYPPP